MRQCYCHGISIPNTLLNTNLYCPRCGQPEDTTCWFCRGRGYVEEFPMERYCAHCGGTIDNRKACTFCGGTGQVPHICSGF